jgi:hypothetical protein
MLVTSLVEGVWCIGHVLKKYISKVVWETLSKARHANEKLAWDGEGKIIISSCHHKAL